MGAWGTALFSNDTACDVRGDYIDLLCEGVGNEEATQKMLEKHADTLVDDEAPLFWYALADVQWGKGRLHPQVKEKALDWIAKEGGIELWEEVKKVAAWRATLNELRDKLLSPMPAEKKVSKPRAFICDWKPGDIYAYQFHGDFGRDNGLLGKYIAMRVLFCKPIQIQTKYRISIWDQLWSSMTICMTISRNGRI